MRYKILLAIIFILVSKFSFSQENETAPEWLEIGTTSDGNKYYSKSEYVKKDEEGIKLWIKAIFKTQTINKVSYKNVVYKALLVVNCDEKQIKAIKTIYYSSTGKVIKSVTVEDFMQKWDDPAPNTMGERIVNFVCLTFNE